MKDEEGFYYPHNLDFRGRAYPMHPYLNHLGSDLCRGILEFAEGRPLGQSGLRWLKIHLASLFGGGVDKLSYDGRITFTENHLEDIFDSADRPLEGRRWWLGAEDPFQCLAVCINLAEALRSSSPETTISHTPVHQVIFYAWIYDDLCLLLSFLFFVSSMIDILSVHRLYSISIYPLLLHLRQQFTRTSFCIIFCIMPFLCVVVLTGIPDEVAVLLWHLKPSFYQPCLLLHL